MAMASEAPTNPAASFIASSSESDAPRRTAAQLSLESEASPEREASDKKCARFELRLVFRSLFILSFFFSLYSFFSVAFFAPNMANFFSCLAFEAACAHIHRSRTASYSLGAVDSASCRNPSAANARLRSVWPFTALHFLMQVSRSRACSIRALAIFHSSGERRLCAERIRVIQSFRASRREHANVGVSIDDLAVSMAE